MPRHFLYLIVCEILGFKLGKRGWKKNEVIRNCIRCQDIVKIEVINIYSKFQLLLLDTFGFISRWKSSMSVWFFPLSLFRTSAFLRLVNTCKVQKTKRTVAYIYFVYYKLRHFGNKYILLWHTKSYETPYFCF